MSLRKKKGEGPLHPQPEGWGIRDPPHSLCNKANGNIIFVRKYGTGETQNLFKCTTCKRTFSERRGTPLFECHLPDEKVYQILKCLSEGNGIRATSRIVGVSKDTVGSIINRIGDHMEDVAATLMTDYHLEECQWDELWGDIFKKKGL